MGEKADRGVREKENERENITGNITHKNDYVSKCPSACMRKPIRLLYSVWNMDTSASLC